MRSASFCALLVISSALVGCGGGDATVDPAIPVATQGGTPPGNKCPDTYWVKFETTKGDVLIEVQRAWSPYGADRFYELVKDGFYDGCRFFRTISGFVAQVGINGDPKFDAKWRNRNIPDDRMGRKDPNRQSNQRGYVSFAMGGPNTRTTQIFINSRHNSPLDRQGFTPFGRVIDGMAAVDSFYSRYGEEPQNSATRIELEGNAYLDAAFPKLDSIKKATLLTTKPAVPTQPAG